MTSPLQQKIKITGPSVVTANRTWDGVVIYRTAAKDWSTDLSRAAIVSAADEARALLAESVADDLGAQIRHIVADDRVGGARKDIVRTNQQQPPFLEALPRPLAVLARAKQRT